MAEQRKSTTVTMRTTSRPPAPVPTTEAPKESAVARLLLTPLAFLSFLLSLALVSERNVAVRTSSHEAYPNTFLGRVKSLLHFILFKRVDRSPYAYVRSPNVELKRAGTVIETGEGKQREKEPWHWHTNQRHMLKVEMDDAFRVRKWVLLALGMGLVFMLGVVGWATWWGFGWVRELEWRGSGREL